MLDGYTPPAIIHYTCNYCLQYVIATQYPQFNSLANAISSSSHGGARNILKSIAEVYATYTDTMLRCTQHTQIQCCGVRNMHRCNAAVYATYTNAMLRCTQHTQMQCCGVHNIHKCNAAVYATYTNAMLRCTQHTQMQCCGVRNIHKCNVAATRKVYVRLSASGQISFGLAH